ncbi:sensor histidine kinase [Methanogenium organophilum]|uniref:histidine kinase n=1 Tax=Methanogenium organophilum TaxID=2199 RepID=A0A9X9T9I4_METOG|nr:PAS domain S-box protein [Methanogenium organophilum]WAI02441.1 PAS domain S-box protein [Methanogenium organophilum]
MEDTEKPRIYTAEDSWWHLNFWVAVILTFSIISVAIILYGISIGITNLTPYLFLIPIIFVAYRYPERGISFSLIVGILNMVLHYPFIRLLAEPYLVFVNSIVLVGAGVAISLLSGELNKEKARYEAIFSTSQAGILLIEYPGLVIREVNSRLERMLVYSPGELQGAHLSQIWKDGNEMEAFFSAISDVRSASDVETRLLRRNGEEVVVLLSVGSGYGKSVVLTVTDITARKIAEKEREQERLRSQTYLNTAGVMLFVVKANHTIALANRRADEVLGTTEELIIGKDWFSSFLPEIIREEERNKFNRILTGKRVENDSFEYPILTTKGERLIAGHFTALRDENGLVTSVLYSADDVTEARRMQEEIRLSEANYRTLFEVGGAATAILTREGILTLINTRFERLSGYTKAEVENRMRWYDFIPEREQIPGKKGEESAHPAIRWPPEIDAGGMNAMQPREYEVQFQLRDKTYRDVIIWTSAIPETDHYVASILDISSRKRAEDELRRSLQEKEVLLKEVHHRVKNNMQVISSLISLQSDKISDPESLERLRESQNRIKSMALVHESLYQSENLASIDPAGYLRNLSSEVIASYSLDTNIAVELGITVHVMDIDTALPCGLIVNELISNSLKHAFKGKKEGKITIELTETDEEYILSVRDDGCGLPADFDIARLDSLGIKLINVLTRQMRGTIEIETSRPGGAFTFHIPRTAINHH